MTLYLYMYVHMYVLTLYMHIFACIQGDWVDDERSGEGEFTYNTGDVYRGRWSEDRQSECYTPATLSAWCHCPHVYTVYDLKNIT